AVAPAGARMLGVALELADLAGCAVDVGEQAARRFAVEAGGGHQHVAALDALGPGPGVELDPVVPALLGRERGKVDAARARVTARRRLPAHASGTDWPACT